MCFLWIEGGVNAAEDNIGTPRACHPANIIASQCIRGVDANADDIAALDAAWIHRIERFVNENRVAEGGWGSGGKHIQPTRRNDRNTKRHVAWIDEVNLHVFCTACKTVTERPTGIRNG